MQYSLHYVDLYCREKNHVRVMYTRTPTLRNGGKYVYSWDVYHTHLSSIRAGMYCVITQQQI